MNGDVRGGRYGLDASWEKCAYRNRDVTNRPNANVGFRWGVNGVWKSGWISYASSYHRVEYRRATNTVLSNGDNTLGFRSEWCI